jgi:hypothetical protein
MKTNTRMSVENTKEKGGKLLFLVRAERNKSLIKKKGYAIISRSKNITMRCGHH